MALVPRVKDNDWTTLRQVLQKLSTSKLGTGAQVTHYDLTLSSLTASRLISSDTSGKLVSTDINSWITGTANQITVTDDSDGTVTLSTPQDIHTGATVQFSKVEIGGVSTYIDKDGSNNMTLTDAVVGTRTLKQLGCPTYKYIKATTQAEGDLHLSDATHWGISKALIKYIRIVTSSTDWDLYILQNDNGYATDDATILKLKIGDGIYGNANLWLDLPYEDEDDSDEVHLYFLDNSGTNTADIYVLGFELL